LKTAAAALGMILQVSNPHDQQFIGRLLQTNLRVPMISSKP
jgi:hypothetical protein